MTNISLKLQIDESTNNITVANESINKSFVILGDTKEISAGDIYSILAYKKGNTYSLVAIPNQDDIENLECRHYFGEVFGIFKDIIDEVNNLTFEDPLKELEEIDKQYEEEYGDYDF